MRLVGHGRFCPRQLPQWNPISIAATTSARPGRRRRGSWPSRWRTASPIEWASSAGRVDDFAPSLSLLLLHLHRFLRGDREVPGGAEYLGARARDSFGARNPRSWLMRFHTQTAGVSLTAQQPEVNIVRTAIEAFAAVLGGTQSLHTNSFDEAFALPTEDAVRIALRTQQVIAHETGVVNSIDPLGGSYYVEELTNRIEAQAYEYFDRIKKLGGMVEAITGNPATRDSRRGIPLSRGGRARRAGRRWREPLSPRRRAAAEILKIDPALEGSRSSGSGAEGPA